MGFAQSTMRPRVNKWGKTITAPGCDDAPVVEIAIGDVAKPVSLILPYFNNPKALAQRVTWFGQMPDGLRAHLELIVVDDCSDPELNSIDALKGVSLPDVFRLYVIKEKKRWNWLAARNIGAHEAVRGSWLAMTDMDHHYPFATLAALVYGPHDPETIYRFTRLDWCSDVAEIHPHANSWFMTKAMFWDRVGGYNEAFSGYYGSDGEFRRRCARTAPIAIMNRPLVRKEHDGDSSTTSYGRKEPQDRAIHELAAQLEGTPPKVLSFPYERVL
jgi:hypothetical protein